MHTCTPFLEGTVSRAYRRVLRNEKRNIIDDYNKSNVSPSEVVHRLEMRGAHGLTARDISNEKVRGRRIQLGRNSNLQALIYEKKRQKWFVRF
jgi:uncharacterized protein with von Willebrand factor type A (vWA) domain